MVTVASFERLLSLSRDGGFKVVALRFGTCFCGGLVADGPAIDRLAGKGPGIGVSLCGSGFLADDGVRRPVGSGVERFASTAAEMSGRRSDPTRDRTVGSGVPVDRRDMEDGLEMLCRLDGLFETLSDGVGIVGRGVTIEQSVMSRVELKSSFVRVASMLFLI